MKAGTHFTWTGSCETLSKSCTEEDTACTPIYPLVVNRDYRCEVEDNLLTLVRYQNASKLAIANDELLKIKAKVKNPNYYTTGNEGGVTVELVSNYARYIYETFSTGNLFATQQISITSTALYLWGLTSDATGSTKPCPVRIYLTDYTDDGTSSVTTTNQFIWNKLALKFKSDRTFPESEEGEGFKMTVGLARTRYINDLSIYTDVGAIGAVNVACVTSYVDGSWTSSLITCSNLAKLSANQDKYIKFSFVMLMHDYLAATDETTLYS